VLAYVEMLMPEEHTYYLEPYANGRERGYLLFASGTDKRAAFSENRNSDAIVLYTGTLHDFAMAGNLPSEDAWKRRQFFNYDRAADAARAIIAHLSGS